MELPEQIARVLGLEEVIHEAVHLCFQQLETAKRPLLLLDWKGCSGSKLFFVTLLRLLCTRKHEDLAVGNQQGLELVGVACARHLKGRVQEPRQPNATTA